MSTSTSRVGRKPVAVPSGVEVKINDQKLAIKGPKGNVVIPIHPFVQINLENNQLNFQPNKGDYFRKGTGAKLHKSIVGTIRSKIAKMVKGVSQGFERKLVLVGVGYRAQVKGKVLTLSIGFSHPVNITAPEGITIEAPSLTEVVVKGVDNHLVGHVASMIRAVRGPEPYKGKGIRYSNEIVEIKETKKK